MMAMAMTAFSIPGPSAATKARARISPGKARKTSVMRIRSGDRSSRRDSRRWCRPARPIGATMIDHQQDDVQRDARAVDRPAR